LCVNVITLIYITCISERRCPIPPMYVLWDRRRIDNAEPRCNALIVILLFLVDFNMFYVFYMIM